jgi:hypothetical protein
MILFNTRTSRPGTALASLLSVSLLCGCGAGKAPWETVHPAKGAVSKNGKPIKDAELLFFPEDDLVPESVRPRARTTENGEFVVSTYGTGDGAPAGTYKVTVIHHQVVIQKDTVATKPNDLPRKYASPETTDLTIEIAAGENQLAPFNLK